MDLGDRIKGSVIDFTFPTITPSTGAPTTLGGTPALSIYPNNSTTQFTTGVTLTVDFDGVTGLNHVRVDTSASASYARRADYRVVITTGTVGGVSAVGYTVGTFSIENRYASGVTARGICPTSASHSTTVVILPATFDFIANDRINGKVLDIRDGTNKGASPTIIAWNNATQAATVSPALPAACDNTTEFDLLVAAPSVTDAASLPQVDVRAIADGLITAAKLASDTITAAKIATGAITSAKFAAGAIDAAAIANDAIDASAIAAGAITAGKFAAGAIDAAAIADNAIDAGAIATGAITAGKFAAGAIDAAAIANGAIDALTFAAGAIDAAAIADNAIDAGAIATGAITAGKFAAGAIDAAAIANDAIDATAIATGAITAAKFAAGAIEIGRAHV